VIFDDPALLFEAPHLFIMASGSTLQAVVAGSLVRRLDLFDHDFSNPYKIGQFFLLVGPVSCLISSTVGLITMSLMDINSFMSLLNEWFVWWIADWTSVVVVITIIFAWIKFDQVRRKIVTAVLAVSLIVTFSIIYVGRSWENERINLLFNQEVLAATNALKQIENSYLSLLNNMAGFKRFSSDINKENFETFSKNNLAFNNTVRSLTWINVVDHADREEFEASQKEVHGESYFIWEFSEDGSIVKAKPREQYHIVELIEPYNEYKVAVGYVIDNDDNRINAVNYSLENKSPALTSLVSLVYSEENPLSVTLYDSSFTEGQIDGYFAVLIRVEALMNEILSSSVPGDLEISLRDTEGGALQVYNSERVIDGYRDFEPIIIEIDLINRRWELDFKKTQFFIDKNKSPQPLFIGIAGIIFSAVISIGIVILSGQRIFLDKLVKTRTKELQNANQAKSEFMAHMSHDLRTPLNAIIGFSEIMNRELYGKIGSEKYREYAKDINLSSEYLLSLINDILDYSEIEADKRDMDKEEINLSELLDKCLSTIRGLSEAKKIYPINNIEKISPNIFADERAMKQILINLLSNAIKYTHEDGEVIVDAQYTATEIWINVTDNGEGIVEENIEKILVPFTRVENDPHLTQEGTGLGLSIVHSLVKLHGGELLIKSEINIGTKVSFSLPL
jgi:two-component system, sensor histidine kinase